MAVIKGTTGAVYDNATKVGSITQWELNVTMDMDETSELGDVAKEPMPTIYGGTATIRGKYNKADGGQGGLWAKMIAGTAITLDLIESGTHGASGAGYTGTFYLKSYQVTASWEKYDEFSASLESSGAIAYSTTM
jgi:hypothetical protein